ncbi:unnamed protein product [Alternaria alternata]
MDPDPDPNPLLAMDPGPRLTAQTEVSRSQPLVNEAQKLLSKYRRTVSDRVQDDFFISHVAMGELTDKCFDDLRELRHEVFTIILRRLKARNITSTLLKQDAFWWCLPTNLNQTDSFRLLLEDPLAVSTHQLNSMLKLEQSTPDSPEPAPNSTLFYVRSFTMTVKDMHDVFQSMLHDRFDMNGRIFGWLEIIDGWRHNVCMTLRYIGQSKNKPWDRHSSDIYSKSLRSFMNRFLKTVGMVCPAVLEQAVVHVFTNASATGGAPLGPNIIELHEQVLIALFGDGVLNTEAGGNDMVALTKEDHEIFKSLGTQTISALQFTKEISTTSQQALLRYAKDVRTYVNQHPTTTKGKSKRHEFTDTTESMLVRQGTPRVLPDGSAVMVTLGSDLGDTHDDDEAPFFEAGGRSAELVEVLYNNFAYWEQGLVASFEEGFTKKLAKQNLLPFFDLFPWFVKHSDDYPSAINFARQYMEATTPFVVLTYGNLSTYAATKSFQPFSERNYNAEYASLRKDVNRKAYWIEHVMGVPQLATFDGGSGLTAGKEFILIPCYHPGRNGHAGIMKTLITRLLTMVSAVAWSAIELAISVDQHKVGFSRKQKCEEILKLLKTKIDPEHEFGKEMMKLKSEYVIAHTVESQNRFMRKQFLPIGKPSKGILPTKVQRRARRSLFDTDFQTSDAYGGGFDVAIQIQNWNGISPIDNKRFMITWTEEDGQVWNIAPVLLPDGALPKDQNDKRYLFYTSGGLDIRNAADESVGNRKPLINGNSKAETIPIASLAITICDQANATAFFLHWEEVTGHSINEVLGSRLVMKNDTSNSFKTADDGFLPASFFENSPSKRGLPFSWVNPTTMIKSPNKYLSLIRANLPAYPGDLVWLINRFLEEVLPEGGDIDPIPGSIHTNSVYRLVVQFCNQAKYKYYPHLRTFLAFASMAEMGNDERFVPANAFMNVMKIIFGDVEHKRKTARVKINGESKTMDRLWLTVGKDRETGVIHDVEDPELEQDIIIEEDVTEDEDDEVGAIGARKRRKEDDEDQGEGSSILRTHTTSTEDTGDSDFGMDFL